MEEYWGSRKQKRKNKSTLSPGICRGFVLNIGRYQKNPDFLVPYTVAFYLCIQPTTTEMFKNILKEQNQFTYDSFFTPLKASLNSNGLLFF